jgi:hypothetical protein
MIFFTNSEEFHSLVDLEIFLRKQQKLEMEPNYDNVEKTGRSHRETKIKNKRRV